MAHLNTPQPPTGIPALTTFASLEGTPGREGFTAGPDPYRYGTLAPVASNLFGDASADGRIQTVVGGPIVPAPVAVTANRSLAAADSGLLLNVSAGVTLTVPAGLPATFACVIAPVLPMGGSVSIAASGTTLNGAGTTLTRNYTCSLQRTATNAFAVS